MIELWFRGSISISELSEHRAFIHTGRTRLTQSLQPAFRSATRANRLAAFERYSPKCAARCPRSNQGWCCRRYDARFAAVTTADPSIFCTAISVLDAASAGYLGQGMARLMSSPESRARTPPASLIRGHGSTSAPRGDHDVHAEDRERNPDQSEADPTGRRHGLVKQEYSNNELEHRGEILD